MPASDPGRNSSFTNASYHLNTTPIDTKKKKEEAG